MLKSLIESRRTIRLFQQQPIPDDTLAELIDLARQVPSAANLQQLRYVICRTPEVVSKIFPLTGWAKLVSPKRTPEAGKTAPTAFIAVLGPAKSPAFLHADAGAAILAILLGAKEAGLGACWLGSFDQAKTAEIVGCNDKQAVLYLIALGYPAESPRKINVTEGDSVAYFIDDNGTLTVPKLTAESITRWI